MDAGNWTLEALVQRYTRAKVLATPTKDRYELVARNLARFLIHRESAQASSVLLSQITSDVLVGFRDWSLTRMRAVSFNTERRHLSSLFNFAVRLQLMPANPFREVAGAPVESVIPKSLPRADMREYINYLATATRTDERGRHGELFQAQWFWLAVIRTFYLTGMRKRQLLGLRWRDIDFNAGTIRLAASSSKTKREWYVPLPDALLPDLHTLKQRTIQIVGPEIQHRQVFCRPLFAEHPVRFKHKELTGDVLDNFFQRLRKAAPVALPRISSHRIRHTTATILANTVPNLKVVQELLGHTSINTTYGYVHPDIDSMRKAVNGSL